MSPQRGPSPHLQAVEVESAVINSESPLSHSSHSFIHKTMVETFFWLHIFVWLQMVETKIIYMYNKLYCIFLNLNN